LKVRPKEEELTPK